MDFTLSLSRATVGSCEVVGVDNSWFDVKTRCRDYPTFGAYYA